ncbi:hypothetical protein DTO027I6_5127 [Penicillium roqueforti]|uniref:uncharacterized protein n=1 Tax=Penicillium roqueforti TaxID=5082 RepID=UPI00190A43AE|nr:uncharacterized protein LCP9604111_6372 [Penicillium roqueforti]KAF9246612.1 hypothetical protein LCP9604111_6372 [Penicillium roqueforti]KAI2733926.1 hypothetical protein CBS147332_941 [Penicillium roqueforti]KAI3106105.1 hypothetical protein CBS147331_6814 [Penicillium roqueforti]KAI3112625.1 hypothetical protein CBS147333_3599 [Penicillium roqueforti]KAI3128275.1 hypothetical protein CBS147326_6777 [Penicillium roqueforti]
MMDIKNEKDLEGLDPSQSREIQNSHINNHDDVFGEITESGPNYRNVGWAGTVILMMKSQIGLGVLSIPSTFDTLGLVPGVICLIVVAVITTWSDYMVGVFKLNHRSVYGIDDAGYLMFGVIGREVFGFVFCLYWIFVAGSGMLGLSIALNSVSSHATCTAVYVAVAAVAGIIFASIRTLGKISWLAWIGLTCILAAIFIVTIAVGVQDRPASAPQEGIWVSDYKIVASPKFSEAISAVSSIIFAYAGTPAFFSIVSEMRDPKYYTRSLIICQSSVTAVYVTIGVVVYYYCGSYVASPALGSAGDTMKKVSYGFAIPGLLVTVMLFVHLPAKFVFVRALRGSKHLTSNSMVHWGSWIGCTAAVGLISYVIASAIPVFDSLVSLIGALLGTFMCFQPMGCMWLYDNWGKGKVDRSPRWMFMVSWSVFVIVIGSFMMVAGTYGSVVSIMDSYKANGGSAAWSCADNSNSS